MVACLKHTTQLRVKPDCIRGRPEIRPSSDEAAHEVNTICAVRSRRTAQKPGQRHYLFEVRIYENCPHKPGGFPDICRVEPSRRISGSLGLILFSSRQIQPVTFVTARFRFPERDCDCILGNRRSNPLFWKSEWVSARYSFQMYSAYMAAAVGLVVQGPARTQRRMAAESEGLRL